MAAEVRINTQRTTGTTVLVRQRGRHLTTRDILVVLQFRLTLSTRIRSIPMGDIAAHRGLPLRIDVVAQLQHAAILLEAHIGAMVVRAVILSGNGGLKPSESRFVQSFGLHGTITAHAHIGMRITAIVEEQRTGDDIDDTTHRIRAIDHGGRATQHLHPIGYHRLITVAEWVTEDALILRMSIDEHQHLTGATRDAAQVDAACRTRRCAIAHHAATGHKETRHLLHHRGQDVRLMFLGQGLTVDDGNGHWQVTHINRVARTRHHDLIQSPCLICRHTACNSSSCCHRVRLSLAERCCREHQQKRKTFHYFSFYLLVNILRTVS